MKQSKTGAKAAAAAKAAKKSKGGVSVPNKLKARAMRKLLDKNARKAKNRAERQGTAND